MLTTLLSALGKEGKGNSEEGGAGCGKPAGATRARGNALVAHLNAAHKLVKLGKHVRVEVGGRHWGRGEEAQPVSFTAASHRLHKGQPRAEQPYIVPWKIRQSCLAFG